MPEAVGFLWSRHPKNVWLEETGRVSEVGRMCPGVKAFAIAAAPSHESKPRTPSGLPSAFFSKPQSSHSIKLGYKDMRSSQQTEGTPWMPLSCITQAQRNVRLYLCLIFSFFFSELRCCFGLKIDTPLGEMCLFLRWSEGYSHLSVRESTLGLFTQTPAPCPNADSWKTTSS